MKSSHYDIIIIGGGASGMMAAITAAQTGKSIALFEKNRRLGEKLRITGGGRCNITNAEFDLRTLLHHYGNAEQFLYSPFSEFGVEETFSFFESHGLPLIVQDRKRAFPKTEKAEDVVTVFKTLIQNFKNIDVHTNSPVKKFNTKDTTILSIETSSETFTADIFIIATGGLSHSETGSTGDGFQWLIDLGHTVVAPTPSLVPLQTSDQWSHILSGISLEKMKITFFCNNQKKFSQTGKLLFTHFGLSGPLILNLAKDVQDLLHDSAVTATIDVFPDIDHGTLEQHIIATFDANKNKVFKNVLATILPTGITKGVLVLTDTFIDSDTKVHSVTKEQRKQLMHLLKGLPISIEGLAGYEKSIVADGGVPLNEVDTKTMRSKIISNLFITGDLLHINRPSGGYSLQLCWTTGYVAGKNA